MTWPEESVMKTENLDDLENARVMKNSLSEQNVKSFPLPPLYGKFSRNFKLDESNIEVTSIDISAHGSYVVIGCSNGMIILFCTAIADHCGVLVGHIHAKGLHTNLLLTVKITEDCRFCFGGVMTGSSEILAIDMGRLPVDLGYGMSDNKVDNDIDAELITIFSHFDPKLRGFGNAARVSQSDKSCIGSKSSYRLVCGRARLLHIWQFSPESPDQWTCMYDVSTNGNTIECIEFRSGGHEILSKSMGANIRVWNLRQYETDRSARPSYDDIPNSADVKSLLGDFAFGGVYNFAVVKIGAPKEANRDAFEMPERSTQDDNGQRRKRMMRQIDEVIGTHDARHALVLCTDGGVMYFQNNSVGDIAPCLVEFSTVQRDPEVERAWNLRRVGRDGDVVLLRASRVNNPATSASGPSHTRISVMKLSDAAPEEVKCTALSSMDAVSWSDWGYYHDSSSLPLRMTSKDPVPLIPSSAFAATSYVASTEPTNSTNAPSLSSLVLLPSKKSFSDYSSLSQSESLALPSTGSLKPPLGPTIIRKIGLNASKHSENWVKNTPGRPSLGKSLPSSLAKSIHVKQQRPVVCKEEAGDSIEYATPAIASAALIRLQPTISPEESIARLISSKAACTSSPSTESAFKIKSSLKRLRTVTHSEINAVVCGIAETRHAHVPPSALSVSTGIAITSETVETAKEPEAKNCAAVPYSAPPAIPEIEESTKIHPRAVASTPSQELMKKFNSLKHAWVSLCREPVNVEPFSWSHLPQTSDPPAQHSSSSSAASSSLGVCALQKLGVISLEQDRVKAQFVTEVCRALESTVRLTASILSKWADTHHYGPTSSITQIVDSCRKQSAAQLRRHDLELIGARAQDEIFRHQNPSLPRPTLRLTCRHTDIFRTAILFDSLVQSLVRQYSCEEAHQATETEAEAKAETETESELKPFMEGGAGAPLRAEICNSGRNPTDI